MIVRKVCLLGKYYVGKSSLVHQFVHQQFDDSYLSTLGLKIDSKVMNIDKGEVKLVIWDIQASGEDNSIDSTYLKGAHGFLVVADGTRPDTIDTAFELRAMVEAASATTPICLLLNKCDLFEQCAVGKEQLAKLEAAGVPLIKTSAKTGENVELAFTILGNKL